MYRSFVSKIDHFTRLDMDIEKVISRFLLDDIGSIIITDDSRKIVYMREGCNPSEKIITRFLTRMPAAREGQKRVMWELINAAAGKYYRVGTSSFVDEGRLYQCHCLTDVTDFMNLSKDISDYSRKISDLSDFQAEIMTVVSKDYDMFLPATASYCKCEEAVILMECKGDERLVRSSCANEIIARERIMPSEETEAILNMKRFERRDGFRCLMSEKADDRRYTVLVKESEGYDKECFKDISVYNVVRLYVENGILREKIIYESEHDGLTGLFNLGQYYEMKSRCFDRPFSLAVNMISVSDLEYMNDHYGHEAGDCIIKRAADCIRPTLSDSVLGFRLGGDKFAVIGMDISEEKSKELYETWKRNLEELNNGDDRLKCMICCGSAYGKGDYDPDKLMEQADVGLYREKRRLKEELIRRAANN